MNRRPELTVVAPGASAQEAAAVVTAVQQFLRDHAPVIVAAAPQRSPWLETSLREGVTRAPGFSPSWI